MEEIELTGNEKKKEYLKGYERAVRQMQRIELSIKELRSNKMFPCVVSDGMPHALYSSDLSAYAAKLDREVRGYLKARYKRLKISTEIIDKIERMDNEDEKDVLMYRYINLFKWEDICIKMNHSWQHVHRIHSRALENFKM